MTERFADDWLKKESRLFLQEKHVYAYRGKKITDIPDDDIARVCHWYCEENDLVDEFFAFRDRFLADYCFCELAKGGAENGRMINGSLCMEIQMAVAGSIPMVSIPEYQWIDWEAAPDTCANCVYSASL